MNRTATGNGPGPSGRTTKVLISPSDVWIRISFSCMSLLSLGRMGDQAAAGAGCAQRVGDAVVVRGGQLDLGRVHPSAHLVRRARADDGARDLRPRKHP